MTDEKIIQRIEIGLKPIYAASDEELSLGINERNNTTEVYANAWGYGFFRLMGESRKVFSARIWYTGNKKRIFDVLFVEEPIRETLESILKVAKIDGEIDQFNFINEQRKSKNPYEAHDLVHFN